MAGIAKNTKIHRIQPVCSEGEITDLILHCSYNVAFDSETISNHEGEWIRDLNVWASMNEGQKNQFLLLYDHFIEQMTEYIGPE